jgi:hypothetical protein
MNQAELGAAAPGRVWGTVDGVPVADEDIARLVADAEAGFPGAEPRPVGRPSSVGPPARTSRP